MTKRRGGRPKKTGDREPNGKLQRVTIGGESYSKLEIEAMTWRRARDNPGIPAEELRKPEYGSVIDKMLARSDTMRRATPGKPHPNAFTRAHYDTAVRYAEVWSAWVSAIDAKRMRSSSEFGKVGGHPPDPFIAEIAKKEERAIKAYKEARRAVLECGSSLGCMALEAIVIENHDAENLQGDLRQALNALGRLWGMQRAA